MSGVELLIVDEDDAEREVLRTYFDEQGFISTAVGSAEEAQLLVTRKFFPVALVDLDVGGEDAGVEVLALLRAHSRPTAVVMLTAYESFGGAMESMRRGALDVVPKEPGALARVAGLLRRSAESYQVTDNAEIFREVRAVLDESFKVMLGLSRKVYAHLSLAAVPVRPAILVVDGDQEFLRALAAKIQDRPWDILGEMNGGGALDKGMSTRFDIVASRDELMDLRGSMVIRSIQTQHPAVLGILYSTSGAGRLERVVQGQVEASKDAFRGPDELVRTLEAAVEELSTRAAERRFIQAFSADHREFLKRYADLKLKIDRLISD